MVKCRTVGELRQVLMKLEVPDEMPFVLFCDEYNDFDSLHIHIACCSGKVWLIPASSEE